MRLIDQNGEQIGLVDLDKAFALAEEANLDLVAVAEKSDPPVCRILDFGKLKYEKKRKQRNQKNQQSQKIKEVRFHANIEEHDYNYKLKHARQFLEKGNKVKLQLFFRGREMAHKSAGFELINNAVEELKQYGTAEKSPKLAGKVITVTLNPNK